MTLRLERTALPEVPWTSLDTRSGRTVYQTLAWLDFLVETQQAEPVVARVMDGPTPTGWFTGAITRRAGLRVLGSPMRGWTTAAMGFTLDPGVSVTDALAALPAFAFGELACVHLEIADRSVSGPADVPAGYTLGALDSYTLSLTARTDDDLLAGMSRSGRRDVRRALRNGIVVEEVAHDDRSFVDQYYQQVSEAFAKRQLVPTYGANRIAALLRHLGPTGNLLLLRAHTPDGEVAATGIFPGLAGSVAEFWMGASHRRHQNLLPNEALMWQAIRTWRDRGAHHLDFGGGGSYKAKYGGTPHQVPWVRQSRFAVMETGRQVALRLYRRRQELAGGRAR